MSYERDLTIDEFCDKHRISNATFYNYQKANRGPVVEDRGIGGLIITPEADRAWVEAERLRAQQDGAWWLAERRKAQASRAGQIAAKSKKHRSNRGKR